MLIPFLTKMILYFSQENDAKFRFAIHSQEIMQFHDYCKIIKCQTVTTLAPDLMFFKKKMVGAMITNRSIATKVD